MYRYSGASKVLGTIIVGRYPLFVMYLLYLFVNYVQRREILYVITEVRDIEC